VHFCFNQLKFINAGHLIMQRFARTNCLSREAVVQFFPRCFYFYRTFRLVIGKILPDQTNFYQTEKNWQSQRWISTRLPNPILPIPFCRIPYCRLLLKMTKFHHIIFYLKKNIDDVYIFVLKAVIFHTILIRKNIIKCILIVE
jgi:hypothetical protein